MVTVFPTATNFENIDSFNTLISTKFIRNVSINSSYQQIRVI